MGAEREPTGNEAGGSCTTGGLPTFSNVFWLSALAVSRAVEAAALSPPMDRNTGSPADAAGPVPSQAEPSSTAGTSRAVDGPAFATALIAEAIKNDGKLSDGAKLTAKELHRRLEKAGVTVARSGLYENSDYEGVRKLGKKLGLFVKLPEKRNQADAVRRGSKDKHKGQTETADHRELPPDQIAHSVWSDTFQKTPTLAISGECFLFSTMPGGYALH